jgi:hypothetical protein
MKNACLKVAFGADRDRLRAARPGQHEPDADPHQIRGTGVLQQLEQRRVRLQHRGHAKRGEPHRHLIAGDASEGRGSTRAKSSLAGESQQRKRPRPRQHQESEDGRDEGSVIGNTQHQQASRTIRCRWPSSSGT